MKKWDFKEQTDNGNIIYFSYQTYTEFDYDYYEYTSIWYKDTKSNRKMLLEYLNQKCCDYARTEYDCNGSLQIRSKLKISKKRRKIHLIMYVSKDV